MTLSPDSESLREFNPCHDPDSGKFCSGRGWDVAPTERNEKDAHAAYMERRRKADAYTPPDTRAHKALRYDKGLWGASHTNSFAMAGYSAELMGIAGWRSEPIREDVQRIVRRMLSDIAASPGSEEMLYHAFQNTRGTHYKPGDVVRLPITAAAGEPRVSYALRMDRADQTHAPILLEFPKGTPMVAYDKWGKSDAKEFGHVYTEALVAGEFRVVSARQEWVLSGQHDSRTKDHYGAVLTRIVRVAPTAVFDPASGDWVKR